MIPLLLRPLVVNIEDRYREGQQDHFRKVVSGDGLPKCKREEEAQGSGLEDQREAYIGNHYIGHDS